MMNGEFTGGRAAAAAWARVDIRSNCAGRRADRGAQGYGCWYRFSVHVEVFVVMPPEVQYTDTV
jgi:hypothetical protein